MFRLKVKSEKTVKQLSIAVLGVLFLATGLLIAPTLKTKTAYDLEQFLPKGDHTLETAKKIREKYQLSENPALVVLLSQKDQAAWLTTDAVKQLTTLTNDLGQVDGVSRSLSFATRPGAEMSADQLQVGKLTEIVPAKDWATRFETDALMTPLLLSEDQKTALIYLELATTDIPKMKAVFGQVKVQSAALFPGSEVHIGGIPALQAGFQSMLESEVFRFVGFSFLATIFLIFALFRGFQPVLISIVTVVASNIAVLGVLSLLKVDLTVLTVTVPIMVTVTVMAQLVHTFFRLFENRRDESWTKHVRVQKDLFFPNFLANLTTAVGFATLVPSDIPMISQYGMVVGSTVMVSWIMATLILPPLTLLASPPTPRAWAMMKARWMLYIIKYKKEFTVSILAVSIFASVGAFTLNWNNRVFDDLPANHEGRITTEKIDQQFGGVIPLNVELTVSNTNFWNDPKNLIRLDDRIQSLRETAGVGQVLSVVDYLKAFDSKSPFPKSSAAVAELKFLYTLSGPSPLREFISADNQSVRLQMKIRDIPAPEMATLVAKIDRELKADFPEATVVTSGMANHLHATNNRVSEKLIFGFWEAMFAIFLILIPVFRSARWALVACLPNLVPPALLLGVMAIMQTPIKPPLALIFSISLGLAFNNTCYVFDRLQTLIKQGRRVRLIEHVFHKEGMNCLHSTLVVLAGFAVFLFAEFSVNQTFGAFMLMSIVAGIIGDLVFLPALLAWQPGLLGLKPVAKPVPAPILVPALPNLTLVSSPSTSRSLEMSVSESVPENDFNKAASLILFFLIFAVSPHARAGNTDLKPRFQKAMKQFESKDEAANVKLSIIEADGSTTVREIELQRAGTNKEQRMLGRILSPSDLKGTSFLSIVTKEDENQWVYLPSSKQVRKVVASESSDSGVLGSELRYEDFDPSVIRETEVTLAKTEDLNGKKHDVLEAILPKGQSPYEKVQVWVMQGKEIPTQIDYYAKGQKTKTIQFMNYKKVGKVVRPMKMVIRNLKNKRGTDIELSQVKINKGLPAAKLSVDSLAKAW